MHDTPPPPPVVDRTVETLLEDLCVALRYVGVQNGAGPRGRQAIEEACEIKRELDKRGVDPTQRLTTLTQETRWRMDELLKDCLDFPRRTPEVKELDGVRRGLRCPLCGIREYPLATSDY